MAEEAIIQKKRRKGGLFLFSFLASLYLCVVNAHLALPEVAKLLRPRPADAHKGTMGHALLVAGRQGVAGCAVLAGEACLRSGAGKLTVASPEENRLILQTALPEAITTTDAPETLSAYQAVGIGPGLGLDDHAMTLLHRTLMRAATANIPVVVDADALRLLAKGGSTSFPQGMSLILTPHRGEMAAMVQGLQLNGATLEACTRELAVSQRVTVILKGHPSLICLPDGRVLSCPRGNAGMATAGSGDVLTGLITGLAAQGYAPDEAATLGVWLHATAGDRAADVLGQECMLARDITRHLPEAFRELRMTTITS